MNQRPWLRRAYDKWLQQYDVLIMPTIPFVAHKLPNPSCSLTGELYNMGVILSCLATIHIVFNVFLSLIAEFVTAALCNVQNTSVFNMTGHPTMSLNVGSAVPDDVSIVGYHGGGGRIQAHTTDALASVKESASTIVFWIG